MAKNPWQLPRGYDAATRKALSQMFAALKNARTHISPAAYEALRLGNVQAFVDLVDWESIGKDLGELKPILQDFAAKTGVQLYKDGDITADLLFDIVDARAVIWAQNHTADLVVEIAEEMRQQIRNVMAESTQGLLTYEQAARKIRTNLSLTSRDSAAVDSYYVRQINKLVQSGMTIDKATEKANARADRYAAKLLRKRSQTIARTELANAASNGRRLGWETGVSEGYIDPASTKEWVAEPDACDICGPMDGVSVPMNDEFPSGAMMPPQHPNCRCAAILLPPEYSDEYWTAYAKDGGVSATVSFEKAADTYEPTEGMKVAARRALRWKEEGKAKGAGTPVGWGRATDIAAGRSMSLDIVKRMFSFFSRHEVDKKAKDFDNTSDPSNGRIMWDAWGGDAGFTWSRAIVEREKRKVEKHMAGKHDQGTHGKGGGSGARPYELKPKIVKFGYRQQSWELVDPDSVSVTRKYCGPAFDESIIRGDTDELASGLPRELATAYAIAANASPDSAALLKSITDDPKYPRNAEIEDWMARRSFRDPVPAGYEDYIKKENAFVLDKLRQVSLDDGTTIGAAMDDMATRGLAELKALASGDELSLTMPSARAKKLLAEGRYKTVYETSSPSKNTTRREYLEARERLEGKLGVPDSIADSDRPVYGILGTSGFNYGDTRVYFKDEVKNRTSFTLGDSMDGQTSRASWVSDAAAGNLTKADFWDNYGQTTRLISSLGSTNGLFEFKQAERYERKPLSGYNKSAPVVSQLSGFGYGYVESQIHGGIKLSDVARIAFPPSYKITGPMQRQLDEAGIEVAREEITQTNNG